MNKEMTDGIREAKKYEKMAIRALLPEQAAGHLEVIGNELKAMFTECITEEIKKEVMRMYTETKERTDMSGNGNTEKASGKVKKVTID